MTNLESKNVGAMPPRITQITDDTIPIIWKYGVVLHHKDDRNFSIKIKKIDTDRKVAFCENIFDIGDMVDTIDKSMIIFWEDLIEKYEL